MREEFLKYISGNALFTKEDRILLAVSGGIDSMVMAHLFLSVDNIKGIAHCNFNLRGRESDLDEALVNEFAFSHGLSFHRAGFDTAGYASEKNISIQMAARELRYRWFEEVRIEHDYHLVAIAHNLNDNVETFLINLSRGTGIAGLTGMKPRHNMIIRPLLFATRNAIVSYCTINNINYREDRSNSDIKYLRNRLRHEIIPLFREINPSFDEAVSETARILSETDRIKTDRIKELKASLLVEKKDHITFNATAIRGLSHSPTVIFELFRSYGIGRGQVEDLIRILSGKTGSRIITASHRIFRNRNEIIVIPIAGDNGIRIEADSLPGLEAMKEFLSAEIRDITSGFEIPRSQTTACLDLKKVKFPLILRRWKSGDYFYPLGMSGRKKLSDYFTDRKFPPDRKEKCIILESAGKIAWIVGERIDNRFRITGKTKTAIVLTLRNTD